MDDETRAALDELLSQIISLDGRLATIDARISQLESNAEGQGSVEEPPSEEPPVEPPTDTPTE